MKYTKFKLKNFRGIVEKIDIDIEEHDKKPLCLIGNNESGKTTILNGIKLIGKLCQGRMPSNEELINYRPKVGNEFSGEMYLAVEIMINNEDYKKLADTNKKKEEESIQENIDTLRRELKKNKNKICVSFTYHYEMSKLKGDVEIKFDDNIVKHCDTNILLEYINKNAPNIIYLDDFIFDIPPVIRYSKNNNEKNSDRLLNSTQNKQWQKIFDDILKGTLAKGTQEKETFNDLYSSIYQQYDFLFSYFITFWVKDNPKDEDAPRQRMRRMNKFLDKAILKDWEDISGLKSSFEGFEIKREASENGEFDDYSLFVHEGENVFNLSERSKGCRWFFSFKILTQIRSHRDDSNIIFLLDEPASNLHIYPQDRILQNLKRLAKKKQVIYSTHAPHLIDTNNLSNCLIVHNKKIRETERSDISLSDFNDALSKGKKLQQPLAPILERATLSNFKINNIWEKVKDIDTFMNVMGRVALFFGKL